MIIVIVILISHCCFIVGEWFLMSIEWFGRCWNYVAYSARRFRWFSFQSIRAAYEPPTTVFLLQLSLQSLIVILSFNTYGACCSMLLSLLMAVGSPRPLLTTERHPLMSGTPTPCACSSNFLRRSFSSTCRNIRRGKFRGRPSYAGPGHRGVKFSLLFSSGIL